MQTGDTEARAETADMAGRPAGWYPDPWSDQRKRGARYWNGTKWTEDRGPSSWLPRRPRTHRETRLEATGRWVGIASIALMVLFPICASVVGSWNPDASSGPTQNDALDNLVGVMIGLLAIAAVANVSLAVVQWLRLRRDRNANTEGDLPSSRRIAVLNTVVAALLTWPLLAAIVGLIVYFISRAT